MVAEQGECVEEGGGSLAVPGGALVLGHLFVCCLYTDYSRRRGGLKDQNEEEQRTNSSITTKEEARHGTH